MEPSPHPTLDSLTTVRADGSRRFVYPADVAGPFTRARRISGAALVGVYLLLPWIKVNGYPAVFLDVAGRRFHLFGFTLAAQDLWLLFFLITGLGFSLFFVTSLFGRIWCGWACPQTIFLDHVYRRIERWMEGDALARRQLASAPWTAGKVLRRAAKHVLYVACAAAIAHLFLAYFVSLPQLWSMMRTAPGQHWSGFVFIGAATGVLYFNFGWFREQLCVVICPYGRLQSALVDDHTLIIGYDSGRGEPRRAHSAEAAPGARSGDCVDCDRCVRVCPTAIDIRAGLQLECIGCAACVDACDEVMSRQGRPRGLIRYDSLHGLAGRRTRWLRPRTTVYGVLLAVGASFAGWAFSTVRPANFGITRMIGAPYLVDQDFVRNQFLVRIVNKDTSAARFVLRVDSNRGDLVVTGFEHAVAVPPMEEVVRPLILQEPRSSYSGPFAMTVTLGGQSGEFHIERRAEFLGPDVRLLREEEEGRRAGVVRP